MLTIFKKAIIIFLLFTNLFVFAALVGFNQNWNSDVVNGIALIPKSFGQGTIYLPADNAFFLLPYFILLFALFHYSQWLFIIAGLLHIFFLFAGFFFFYTSTLNKTQKKIVLLYILPLFLLVNQSPLLYQIVFMVPLVRYPVLGFVLYTIFIWDNQDLLKNHSKVFTLFYLLWSLFLTNDPYYFFVFVLPLILAFLLTQFHYKSKSNTPSSMTIYLLLFSGFLSLLFLVLIDIFFNHFIIMYSPVTGIAFNSLFRNLSILTVSCLQLFSATIFDKQSALSLISSYCHFVLLLLGVSGLIVLFCQSYKIQKIVGIFLPLMFFFICFLYVLSATTTDEGTVRYLFPLPFLLMFGHLTNLQLLIVYKKTFFVYILLIVAGIGLTIGTFLSSYQVLSYQQKFQTNFTLLQKIQQQHVTYGYSDYWDASLNTFLAEETIKIRAVNCTTSKIIVPQDWLSNKDWYAPTMFSGRTFLLIPTNTNTSLFFDCSKQTIEKQFGKPASISSFSIEHIPYSLYVFPYNIAEKF